MTFTNQAALLYNSKTVVSNTIAGEMFSPLSLSKSALAASYSPGETLTYSVTIINSSAIDYTNLSLLDDLGKYDWNGFPRFPLAYADGSASLNIYSGSYINPGTVSTVTSADGIIFSFDIPANSTALLNYEVNTTPFASPANNSVITNTATLNGNAPLLPLSVQNTLPVAANTDLSISKTACNTAVSGQQISFVFTISNYGNTPTQESDFVTLSDQLDPPLTNISVTANGTPWQEGTQYYYDNNLYYFLSSPGAIQLPAASFSQDSFGHWNTSPASLIITISGTVSPAAPTQSLISILPAYADGREKYFTVQRLQNDLYSLAGTSAIPAAFSVISYPDCPLKLVSPTDSRFSLENGILSVDSSGFTGTISAYILVGHGSGFILKTDYTQ